MGETASHLRELRLLPEPWIAHFASISDCDEEVGLLGLSLVARRNIVGQFVGEVKGFIQSCRKGETEGNVCYYRSV